MPGFDSLFDFAPGLPPEAQDVYAEAFTSEVGKGSTTEKAREFALRRLRHAGWFSTATGWKQMGPDVRDKVSIREAVQQPNGLFLVQDVDVFYPNAVKGSQDEKMFTAERIRRAIENTNRSVKDGGQTPGLTFGHPKPDGPELEAQGKAINFRESPKGPGWARCDMIDVAPQAMEAWKSGQYVGLSAGLAADASDLNLRFGHIALLGGDMQALSKLPMTEIYAADNQVCFSAAAPEATGSQDDLQKGQTMKRKEMFAALKASYSALQTACAAAEAGEPGAEDKVKEAVSAHAAACGRFAEDGVEGHPDAAQDVALMEKLLDGQPAAAPAAAPAPVAAAAEPPKKDEDEDEDMPAEFSAKLEAVQTENRQLRQAVAGLYGQKMLTEWSEYLQGLRAKGHDFSAEAATATYKRIATDQAAVSDLRTMLESTPVKAAPVVASAPGGATFGSAGSKPVLPGSTQVSDEDVMKLLRDKTPTLTFSAEDIKLGTIAMAQA